MSDNTELLLSHVFNKDEFLIEKISDKLRRLCLNKCPLLIKQLAKLLLGQSVNQHQGELLRMTHCFAADRKRKSSRSAK